MSETPAEKQCREYFEDVKNSHKYVNFGGANEQVQLDGWFDPTELLMLTAALIDKMKRVIL